MTYLWKTTSSSQKQLGKVQCQKVKLAQYKGDHGKLQMRSHRIIYSLNWATSESKRARKIVVNKDDPKKI